MQLPDRRCFFPFAEIAMGDAFLPFVESKEKCGHGIYFSVTNSTEGTIKKVCGLIFCAIACTKAEFPNLGTTVL